MQSRDVQKTTKNIGKTVVFLPTGMGLILFWRGTWQISEKIFSDEVSLILGLLILFCISVLKKEEIFKIFGMSH